MAASMKVEWAGGSWDLAKVHEALEWMHDFLVSTDTVNAAKNCQPMRESPLTSLVEDALSILDEMEEARHGKPSLQQG